MLVNLIESGHACIWIRGAEEVRVEADVLRAVEAIAAKGAKSCKKVHRIVCWSASKGWQSVKPYSGKEERNEVKPQEALDKILYEEGPGVMLVLRDFDPALVLPAVRRRVRDCARELREADKVLIFISPAVTLPQDLETDIVVVDYPLPTADEIAAVLDSLCERNGITIRDSEERRKVVEAARGMTTQEAEDALSLAYIETGKFDHGIVAKQKSAAVSKSGALAIYDPSDLPKVGGLESLKKWLQKRALSQTPEAREFGLPSPRGVLLVGVPGCGKSLTAKTVAREWELPLVRFDVGSVMGGLVGQSEANMRRALQVAEAVSPCILWIDEVEKAFAGVRGSMEGLDSGVKAGIFAVFITWMQERKAPVFVVGTCNDVRGIPAELMRKGRFDEIFFVDLPVQAEREEILRIHLKQRKRDLSPKVVESLAGVMRNFTGSEIEEAVIGGLYEAFADGKRDLRASDIQKAVQSTKPLAVTMREVVEGLRAWAEGRATPASDGGVPEGLDLGLRTGGSSLN